LLAELGIRYVCVWVDDEQPSPVKIPEGELYALPIALPLDEVNALWDRRIDIDRYREMIQETFETLDREGANNGRLLVLHLHPWLMGQPFRIDCLDEALGHIVHRQGVWAATGAKIIDRYRRHRPVARCHAVPGISSDFSLVSNRGCDGQPTSEQMLVAHANMARRLADARRW
jgi:hypothetical protein